MEKFEITQDQKSEIETALEQSYGVINRMAIENNGENSDCEELQDCFDAISDVLKTIVPPTAESKHVPHCTVENCGLHYRNT